MLYFYVQLRRFDVGSSFAAKLTTMCKYVKRAMNHSMIKLDLHTCIIYVIPTIGLESCRLWHSCTSGKRASSHRNHVLCEFPKRAIHSQCQELKCIHIRITYSPCSELLEMKFIYLIYSGSSLLVVR